MKKGKGALAIKKKGEIRERGFRLGKEKQRKKRIETRIGRNIWGKLEGRFRVSQKVRRRPQLKTETEEENQKNRSKMGEKI